jgi:hypothetical protein
MLSLVATACNQSSPSSGPSLSGCICDMQQIVTGQGIEQPGLKGTAWWGDLWVSPIKWPLGPRTKCFSKTPWIMACGRLHDTCRRFFSSHNNFGSVAASLSTGPRQHPPGYGVREGDLGLCSVRSTAYQDTSPNTESSREQLVRTPCPNESTLSRQVPLQRGQNPALSLWS